jgi:RNA polymerase sigma factor (sigma-70 family)
MKGYLYTQDQTLALLKKRDRAIQEAVWRAEKPGVEAIALSILGSRADAEQLAADLFADFFYQYVDNIRSCHSIPKYLKTMAQRRSIRRREGHARLVPLDRGGEPAEFPVTDMERDMDVQNLLRWLENCYGKLRPRSRKILKLHYGHELSYSSIAESLGNSKQAVGKTVKKGLSLLRECVERQQLSESRLKVLR